MPSFACFNVLLQEAVSDPLACFLPYLQPVSEEFLSAWAARPLLYAEGFNAARVAEVVEHNGFSLLTWCVHDVDWSFYQLRVCACAQWTGAALFAHAVATVQISDSFYRQYRRVPKFSPYGSVCCACAQRPGFPPRQSFSRTLTSQKT